MSDVKCPCPNTWSNQRGPDHHDDLCPTCGGTGSVTHYEAMQYMVATSGRMSRGSGLPCDCEASGNRLKPKQHGADPHAKNCAVYFVPWVSRGEVESLNRQDRERADRLDTARDKE